MIFARQGAISASGGSGLPVWNVISYAPINPTGFPSRAPLVHGDWLNVESLQEVDTGFAAGGTQPDWSLPDAAPVGTKVVIADAQPYVGHINGFPVATALPVEDPESLLMAEYPVSGWSKWFGGGPPFGKGNAAMFTRTVAGWKIECRPLGQSWSPYAVDLTPFTPGTAWVSSHGHCPRDEGNLGSPIGWKALVGHKNAPFHSAQEAYDNGATTIISAKQTGGWSPGGIKMRGLASETITIIGEEPGVIIGKIECASHVGNITASDGYPSSEPSHSWDNTNKSPEIRIVGSANVLFTEFEAIAGTPGDTGATGEGGTGGTGGSGRSATIRLTDCIGTGGATATASGSAGGQGGTGSAASTSDGDGHAGGDGGSGGGAYVYLTNCTGITAVKNPGAGGAGGEGGAAGGDEGTNPGGPGAEGLAGPTN